MVTGPPVGTAGTVLSHFENVLSFAGFEGRLVFADLLMGSLRAKIMPKQSKAGLKEALRPKAEPRGYGAL